MYASFPNIVFYYNTITNIKIGGKTEESCMNRILKTLKKYCKDVQ